MTHNFIDISVSQILLMFSFSYENGTLSSLSISLSNPQLDKIPDPPIVDKTIAKLREFGMILLLKMIGNTD